MIRQRTRARGCSGTPWQLQLKADGVDPTLALQFDRQRYAANNATKSFADILTATRSTTGTYFDASGAVAAEVTQVMVSTELDVVSTDYVDMQVFQSSGLSKTTQTGVSGTTLSSRRIK